MNRNHRLVSTGDSECLPHLYEEFGPMMVDHLRGMYAFAIWDEPQLLFCSHEIASEKNLCTTSRLPINLVLF